MDRNLTKPAWNSRTIWGSIIMILAFAGQSLGWFEITAEEQATLGDQIVSMLDTGAAIVGMILVWWGRFAATKRLTLV